MSVSINIDPDNCEVKEVKASGEDGEEIVLARMLVLGSRSGISINVGPFTGDESWDAFKAYLADPEGEAKKQEARAKILAANGGHMPPAMAVPRG